MICGFLITCVYIKQIGYNIICQISKLYLPIISNITWPMISIFEKQRIRTTCSIRAFKGGYAERSINIIVCGIGNAWSCGHITSESIFIIHEYVCIFIIKVTSRSPKLVMVTMYVQHLA